MDFSQKNATTDFIPNMLKDLGKIFGHIHYDAFTHTLSGQGGARCAGDQRGLMLAGKSDQLFQVSNRARQGHRQGVSFVNRAICSVKGAEQTVVVELSFQLCSQLGECLLHESWIVRGKIEKNNSS